MDVVRHQIRKTVEPKKATVGVVGVKIRIREMRNDDAKKTIGLDGSGEQIYQLWKVGDMLEEMIGIDRLHGCRRHLLQCMLPIDRWQFAMLPADK